MVKTGAQATCEHIHADAQGNSKIVESCRDITLRRQAENRLRESEQKYRRLSEVTLEGICFNDNSVIIDVNESFARMFGYRREELIGIDALKELIAPEFQEKAAQIVGSHSHMVYEAVGVRKDGSRFPVEIEGRLVQYQGRAMRVAGLRDISERKQTERRLIMMQKMQAIGTLAGGIAHDFNNILSAIMGNAEMGRMEAPPGKKMASRLENILGASQRAQELVAQILSFSRSKKGEARPVKLALIIKEALKLLRSSIPATIEIAVEIEKDVGHINADATQIHQIMMNLCTNAAHAMRSDGGALTIGLHEVEIEKGFQNNMGAVLPGTCIRLRVADTGCGMQAETLGRVFEPYFTTKAPGVGTGLGLSVVHGIVEKYDGWVDVTNQPGQGTVFTILFPKITTAAVAESSAPQPDPTGSETILLLDDDELLVEMNSEILTNLGYRVVSVTAPEKALQIFKKDPEGFDLIVTDQTMPGMTGERLSSRLRRIKPKVAVIICSGYSETMNAQKARAADIDAFLMKSVKIADLARTVRRVLDRHAPSDGPSDRSPPKPNHSHDIELQSDF